MQPLGGRRCGSGLDHHGTGLSAYQPTELQTRLRAATGGAQAARWWP
jgi:hypothetical protein